MNLVLFLQLFTAVGFLMPIDKAIMSVGRPKMKRDAGVKAVFLLTKKTAFTPASLIIFRRPTDVTLLSDSGIPVTRKVRKMGMREILRRIWLFSAIMIKSSESGSKQPTQLIITAHNCHNFMWTL